MSGVPGPEPVADAVGTRMTSDRFILRDREAREAEEALRLAPAAMRSADSRGRERPEPPDALRTVFERDRDRIMHSKAFRRLKHKTQVFVNPEGPLRDAPDAHHPGDPDRARHRRRPVPQRGTRRGHRPGPRRGPLALRAHRRGSPVARTSPRAVAGTTRPRACVSTRSSRTSTCPGRCATGSAPTPGRSSHRPRPRRPSACATPIASPT